MIKEKEESRCIQHIKHYIRKNEHITKDLARSIAVDCDISVQEVKVLVIKIRKKMYRLKERGLAKTNSEALDLAVKQIQKPL